ncbi:Calx-beta domain-containing protein, partial [Sulfuricurvum sp.]|uniref:Calx-beta domain-containing protein n=1 Tax=Sulfuricurvum sp. TaxID=2025608 RepID=UPI003BB60F7C
MAIVPHKISNFDDEFFKIIKKAESFSEKAYYDNGDTPTIGVGFALFDKKSKRLNTNIIAAMKRAGVVISASDKQILDDIEVAFKAGKLTTVDTLTDKLNISISEAQAKAVFIEIKEEYADRVKKKIGENSYNSLLDSKELIALIDIAYNGVIGSNLASAVKNGNRAEAWFQMRYMSNGGESYKLYGTGIANRRISESNGFSLTQPSMTQDDYKQIMRMYTLHKDKIYEVEHDNSIPLKNSDPVKSEYEKDGLINTKISPARDYLISQYGEGINIDGDVQVGKGLASYAYLENNSYSDTLTGTSKNDLIFGERGDDYIEGAGGSDVAYGGDGKDTLIGGEGMDTLDGGSGDDTLLGYYGFGQDDSEQDKLYGGIGDDTYITGLGDIIYDDGNVGRVVYKNIDLSGEKTQVKGESYYEDANFYYQENGNILYVRTKSSTSGLGIEIQNWNAQTKEALGIKLIPSEEEGVGGEEDPEEPNPNPDPDPKYVTVSVSNAQAIESAGTISFVVSLSEILSEDVSIDFITQDGTANTGSDYVQYGN